MNLVLTICIGKEYSEIGKLTRFGDGDGALSHYELVWEDSFQNIVVTSGLNKLLDAALKTGLLSLPAPFRRAPWTTLHRRRSFP